MIEYFFYIIFMLRIANAHSRYARFHVFCGCCCACFSLKWDQAGIATAQILHGRFEWCWLRIRSPQVAKPHTMANGAIKKRWIFSRDKNEDFGFIVLVPLPFYHTASFSGSMLCKRMNNTFLLYYFSNLHFKNSMNYALLWRFAANGKRIWTWSRLIHFVLKHQTSKDLW